MPEFTFRGTVTARNVEFIIEADSIEEAKEMAKNGTYETHYTDESEVTDWTIDFRTGKPHQR